MAWTATRTWSAGEKPTATQANQYWRDNFDFLSTHAHGNGAGDGASTLTAGITISGAGVTHLTLTSTNTIGPAMDITGGTIWRIQSLKSGDSANNRLRFANLGTGTAVLDIETSNVIIMGSGGALGTTATDGFIYLTTMAGTPTGVPTAFTGHSPLVYDTTANKLWVYNGSWRGIALA